VSGARPADRPTAAELATAVHEFLETEILPTLGHHRLRFRTLVAMNALSIVAREADEPVVVDWTTARRIRAGEIRDDDLARLKADVEAKLRVASPRYLERYR
jgi:hypothetical protein